MRGVQLLVMLMTLSVASCESQSVSDEAEVNEMRVIDVSPDSFELFEDFRREVFPDFGWGSVKLKLAGEDSAELLLTQRGVGCGDVPKCTLSIYPCLGGYCVKRGWTYYDGKLNMVHRPLSLKQLKEEILSSRKRGDDSGEETHFNLFFRESTSWSSVHEMLEVFAEAGESFIMIELMADDEEHLSKGIQHKIEQLKGKPERIH